MNLPQLVRRPRHAAVLKEESSAGHSGNEKVADDARDSVAALLIDGMANRTTLTEDMCANR